MADTLKTNPSEVWMIPVESREGREDEEEELWFRRAPSVKNDDADNQERFVFFYDPAHGFPVQCSLMSSGDALKVHPGEKHVLVYRAFGFVLLSIFRLITYSAAACCWTSFLWLLCQRVFRHYWPTTIYFFFFLSGCSSTLLFWSMTGYKMYKMYIFS